MVAERRERARDEFTEAHRRQRARERVEEASVNYMQYMGAGGLLSLAQIVNRID